MASKLMWVCNFNLESIRVQKLIAIFHVYLDCTGSFSFSVVVFPAVLAHRRFFGSFHLNTGFGFKYVNHQYFTAIPLNGIVAYVLFHYFCAFFFWKWCTTFLHFMYICVVFSCWQVDQNLGCLWWKVWKDHIWTQIGMSFLLYLARFR